MDLDPDPEQLNQCESGIPDPQHWKTDLLFLSVMTSEKISQIHSSVTLNSSTFSRILTLIGYRYWYGVYSRVWGQILETNEKSWTERMTLFGSK
jgi:hypothetical protein